MFIVVQNSNSFSTLREKENLVALCVNDNIESVIKLFADDTSLSLALNNPDSRAEILNCLKKISECRKTYTRKP